MCNLNLLISNRSFKDIINVVSFMQSVTSCSYILNDDADGVYFNGTNKVYKKCDKLNYDDFKKDITKSNIILSHQRMATHGFNELSNQPFLNDNFVFLHNGIMSEYSDSNNKDKSDSLLMFEQFVKEFKELSNKDNDREKNIITAIKSIIEDKFGSFSIALYDTKTENTYYFKNSVTNIYFFKSKSMLYITTKEENKIFLNFLGQKFNKMKIKNNSVYRISINNNDKNSLMIYKIAKIKHKSYNFTKDNDINYSCIKDINEDSDKIEKKYTSTILDYYRDYDLFYINDPKKCSSCEQLTYTIDSHFKPICYKCFEMENKFYKHDNNNTG